MGREAQCARIVWATHRMARIDITLPSEEDNK